MTFDPEYRMVTPFFSLIFIKKSKIGILEPNILAGTRDPLSISTPYWGPNQSLSGPLDHAVPLVISSFGAVAKNCNQ